MQHGVLTHKQWESSWVLELYQTFKETAAAKPKCSCDGLHNFMLFCTDF